MPAIDLSILNQRQTPAFYADTLANRPSAGFIGRIFVSTNTFEFYRDNGTTWDLIGGPGTSTVTGTGANGQVSFWNGASTITGSNNLFFDAVNGHLGIGTITPGTALEIDHDQNTIIQLQQTVATNDNRITFINSGVGLWRLGAFYNAGANDFGIFDIAAAAQPVTVKRTTGQVLIGTSTVGSGKLVVASATGDNGVQIVGASAPSLRIDNAESGPTKRAGLGISTATNNFIQGSADRDFCMFNGSTTASPILFGIYDTTNVQEAARISAARNFLIGTTTDSGYKLDVNGTARVSGQLTANSFVPTSSTIPTNGMYLSATNTLGFATNSTLRATLNASGNLGLGVTPSADIWTSFKGIQINTWGGGIFSGSAVTNFVHNNYYDGTNIKYFRNGSAALYQQSGNIHAWSVAPSGTAGNTISFNQAMTLDASGNLGIGTTAQNSLLEVNRTITFSGIDTYAQLVVKTTSGANGKLLNIGVDETNSVSFIQSLNRGTDAMPLTLQRYGGAVLIGTTTEGALGKLQVAGSVAITGQYNTVLPSSSFSYFDGSGQVVSSASSASALYLDTTWNTTGNPDGIYLNVANTASGASSKLLNLKVDNASKFSVAKDGTVAIGNSVAAGVAVSSTHKVSILIGGVQYYLLASNV